MVVERLGTYFGCLEIHGKDFAGKGLLLMNDETVPMIQP